MKTPTQTHVIVGMSGGVDSAVAALLLKQQGYQVEGLFMQNWEADKDDAYCSAEQDLTDARTICDLINIPFKTINFAQEYWNNVFQYFLDEYAAGNTPNPDILCNREIKFKAFLDYALQNGADYIATGHYARCHKVNGQYTLLKGLDNSKDQSYFLHALNQQQLQHSLFPVGELTKAEVRTIAKQAGFTNYAKKDSTGICFIGERKFKEFLKEYLLAQPGEIQTENGEVIGRHEGLMFYTIGQRKGIGIGGKKTAKEAPWFVIDKNISRKILIVAQGQDHPRLYAKNLICKELHWIGNNSPILPLKCSAKIRYRQPDQACTIIATDNNDEYLIEFQQPQRAITPGQAIVFYQNDQCLGGAVIRMSGYKDVRM